MEIKPLTLQEQFVIMKDHLLTKNKGIYRRKFKRYLKERGLKEENWYGLPELS